MAHDIDDALSAHSRARFHAGAAGRRANSAARIRARCGRASPNDALLHLQRKIETALQRIGLEPSGRKFSPHITLARLKATPRGRVMDFLTDHALYRERRLSR